MFLVFSLFLLSLPYWLPTLVVRLRVWIFTRINGEATIEIPGKVLGASQFKKLYAHPAANGRSRGAALSDLFWYWLSPGPEMHQEHLEPGPRYEKVAQTTRQILAHSKLDLAKAAESSVKRILEEKPPGLSVRLRDLMMPIWADFYYRLVFGEDCSIKARQLIVGNAEDVINALKMTRLRNMKRRRRLTQFLLEKLEGGALPAMLPEGFSPLERAYYLQGTFFNTAIVQTSEAMTHLLLFIAQHPEVQKRLLDLDDDRYFDHVINESFRVCPLFGIAHRITSADIETENRLVIPKGSVLCFNYLNFHHAGYAQPEKFDPDRWADGKNPLAGNFMPFGSSANRSCPAQMAAMVTLRIAAKEMLRRYSLSSSVHHTRSMPNRGPCLLESRARPLNQGLREFLLFFIKVRDRWEEVGRSLLQLSLGTFMVWDARRKTLCANFFKVTNSPNTNPGVTLCPFHKVQ